jgi:hypothetical protein
MRIKRRQSQRASRVAHAKTADAANRGEALIKTYESTIEGAAVIGELGAPWVIIPRLDVAPRGHEDRRHCQHAEDDLMHVHFHLMFPSAGGAAFPSVFCLEELVYDFVHSTAQRVQSSRNLSSGTIRRFDQRSDVPV